MSRESFELFEECQLLKGMPKNKRGWRWVYTKPFGNVPSGCWFCNDYSVECEKCKEVVIAVGDEVRRRRKLNDCKKF